MNVIICIALIAAAFSGQGVTASGSSSSLRGTVVNWGSTDGIPQVTVELRDDENNSARSVALTVTQENGQFVFAGVPPGTYRVIATRAGYAQAEFGQRRPSGNGTPVVLATGQQQNNIQIGMAVGGTISGKVTDRAGMPQPFARVEVLSAPSMKPQQIAITNDLGEYRAFWLAPGPYYVRAHPLENPTYGAMSLVNPNSPNQNYPVTEISPKPGARVFRPIGLEKNEQYVTTYHPGTPDRLAADVVDLHAGQVATNVDIIAAVAPTLRIQGTAIDQTTGQPINGMIQATLFDRTTGRTIQSFQFNPANGVFEFSGVIPGEYGIRANIGDLSGTIFADVRTADIRISIPLRNPASVAGRVTADNINFADMRVVLRAIPSGPQYAGSISAVGEFNLPKVAYGDYQVYVAPLFTPPPNSVTIPKAQQPMPADVFVKSVRLGQDDVQSGGLHITDPAVDDLQIVLSSKGASIEGQVIDVRNRKIASATVVLLPRSSSPDYRLDQFKVTTTDSSGRFQIPSIPPGNYNLIAWEDVDQDAWWDAGFIGIFRSYSRPVDLNEGDRNNIEILAVPAIQ
jgi:protocatechuate 3,4-dioxygenase beta subunit